MCVLTAYHSHWFTIYLTLGSVLTNVLLITSCGRFFKGFANLREVFLVHPVDLEVLPGASDQLSRVDLDLSALAICLVDGNGEAVHEPQGVNAVPCPRIRRGEELGGRLLIFFVLDDIGHDGQVFLAVVDHHLRGERRRGARDHIQEQLAFVPGRDEGV